MLTLKSGTSSIVVAPDHGAALTGWMLGSVPLMRRALPQSAVGGDPRAMACFPLLPFANRIGWCRFRWEGVEYRLAPNFGDHPHAIHGVGWQRPWSVIQAHSSSVLLALTHAPDSGWPFAFDAEVRYSLSETALTANLRLINRHQALAPAGIGLHPHFPKANDPALRFNASGAWQNGQDSLPTRHGPPPADWQHAQPRPVASSRLDNCFTGWDGSADILAGPASLRIEATPVFRNLQVFTPSWAEFFCVEPVTHIPNAINRPGLPPEQAMHVLKPGEALEGTVRFIPKG